MGSALQALKKLLHSLSHRHARHSYAQSGEDLIIDFAASAMGLPRLTYLDIGAYHPYVYSNTYLFYKRGMRGVLVEPDPELFDRIRRQRPGDICINAGVGARNVAAVPFFVMSTRTLNTFSEAEAKRYEAMGTHRIEHVLQVPLVTVDSLLQENFPQGGPTVISIDVEGRDFEIVASMHFAGYRPAIICVETITYSEKRDETKDLRISALLREKGYFPYADTYINTIFVDESQWRRTSR